MTSAAGGALPTGEIIDVHVAELRQFFNPIDPAPVPERELDPRIEAFVVEWAREVAYDVPLALRVRTGSDQLDAEEMAMVKAAVHRFFSAQAMSARRRLRHLFQRGRISLVIGLAVLTLFTVAGQMIAPRLSGGFARVVVEGLSIGGWVAMWRPIEVFLYDWWPIRAEARLYDRLAAMPVQITSAQPLPAG
jgi:hypothetical protein